MYVAVWPHRHEDYIEESTELYWYIQILHDNFFSKQRLIDKSTVIASYLDFFVCVNSLKKLQRKKLMNLPPLAHSHTEQEKVQITKE